MSDFQNLQNTPSSSRIVIVGAGIVGSALANVLVKSGDRQVVIIDRFPDENVGSTRYAAPAFVGQLNESKVLTDLAKESVKEYRSIPKALDIVGGLEIYQNSSSETVHQRCDLAHHRGLRASVIDGNEAARLAPDFVDASKTKQALYFPDDGTANPLTVTAFYQEQARAKGAIFIQADCHGLDLRGGKAVGVKTSLGDLQASSIVVAVGIWASALLKNVTVSPLPIVPVAHPYCFGKSRQPRAYSTPYIRWPEYHVYGRDHGTYDGFGTYDHPPTIAEPGLSAEGKWLAGTFDRGLDGAKTIMLPGQTEIEKQFNGIFAVTPDNLPMVGKLKEAPNVYLCSAVWITHAAATAQFTAKLMLGEQVDKEILEALNPNRFNGKDLGQLQGQALRRYNDIYNSQPLAEAQPV